MRPLKNRGTDAGVQRLMKNTYYNRLATGLVMVALLVLSGCASTVLNNQQPVKATVDSADGSPIVYGVRGQGDAGPVIILSGRPRLTISPGIIVSSGSIWPVTVSRAVSGSVTPCRLSVRMWRLS